MGKSNRGLNHHKYQKFIAAFGVTVLLSSSFANVTINAETETNIQVPASASQAGQGKTVANQDTMAGNNKGTSLNARGSDAYKQGYETQWTTNQTVMKQAHDAGYQDGKNGVASKLTSNPVYRKGYSAGYTAGQAEFKQKSDSSTSSSSTSSTPKKSSSSSAKDSSTTKKSNSDTKKTDTNNVATSVNNQNSVTNTGSYPLGPIIPSNQAFIQLIGNDARQIAKDNNLYASVMIAQAALESTWGTSDLSRSPNYNLFGIKGGFQGQSVSMRTQEDNGLGSLYSTLADFRRYNSYQESMQDYANIMKQSNLASASRSNCPTYQDATQALTGKYATDTSYNLKLNQIIQTYHLTDYDHDADAGNSTTTGQPTTSANSVTTNSSNNQNHHQQTKEDQKQVVKPGLASIIGLPILAALIGGNIVYQKRKNS